MNPENNNDHKPVLKGEGWITDKTKILEELAGLETALCDLVTIKKQRVFTAYLTDAGEVMLVESHKKKTKIPKVDIIFLRLCE